MPRVSRHQADLHRLAITAASSRLFRERGVDDVSVAEVMAAAGLTHGGFYGHFESKEALAAAACAAAFAASTERWQARIAEHDDAKSAKAALVENYLSPRSRNAPGAACATATLAGDVARASVDAPIRDAYAAGIEELLRILTGLDPSLEPEVGRRYALADLATMVGAMILARATVDHEVSDELLSAAQERLTGEHKPHVR